MSLVTINIHSCNGTPPPVEATPSVSDELRLLSDGQAKLTEKIDRLAADKTGEALAYVRSHDILDRAGLPKGEIDIRIYDLVAQRDAAVADREALLDVCRSCLQLWAVDRLIDKNDTEAILVRQAVARCTKPKGV
jgi:hypothetical protein